MNNYNPVRGNTLPDEIFYVVDKCFLTKYFNAVILPSFKMVFFHHWGRQKAKGMFSK